MEKVMKLLKREVKNNLTQNILPYWIKNMFDNKNGGFYGSVSGEEVLDDEAPRGAILNARILWTFSSAYRILSNPEYLEIANRAKREIIDNFYDNEYGGIYWSVDKKGNPLDTKKQIYALGFAIYGLSEYYRATNDKEALEYAIKIFNDIENYSFDKERNGYYEAFTREWAELDDMRLSNKDANEKKTMNTHLHILEPYTNLYRVWKDEYLKDKLENLILLFTNEFLDHDNYHLQLFFDDNWNKKHDIISYGHDIEASWLIHEAALVLDNKSLLKIVEPKIIKIADAAAEGFFNDGGMIYEFDNATSAIDAERHWWVQAETVVGYLNIYQHFNDNDSFFKALQCWDFIKNKLVDNVNGEWYWSILADGSINKNKDKAGFWKCPYHNGRMCMEILERF